jgi:hypothetical protein
MKSKRDPFKDLCETVGKSPMYVRNLQTRLGLYIPEDGEGYPATYACFLQTVIALRTFSVPVDDILALFETEKKLLILLKIDTLMPSKTWYLSACGSCSTSAHRLLLTNFDVEPAITPAGIQFNLDFSARQPELFSGAEMGENVCRVMELYRKWRDRVLQRVRAEEPVVKSALAWAENVHHR